jgi:CDGSH-type Zn-finger protein
MLFCRAAAVPQGPHLRGRDHPAAPRADRVVLAEAESRGAGSASTRPPAQRRDVRQAAGRVRGRHRHGLEIRKRYRGPLAARAPKLRKATRDGKKAGYAYVVVDGTLIPICGVAADRPFYSGKHKKHRMSLQVIVSPDGDLLWVSGHCPARCSTRRPS